MAQDKPKPVTGFEVEQIPLEMMNARRWVNWRAVQRDGRWTKIPIDPSTGETASSIDPETWGTFDEAVGAATFDHELGIGFVLGDGWLGVDFDHIDTDGELAAWATQWSEDHRHLYIETSPSRTGLHAICRASKPEWSANRRGNVELYERARFFCVTGWALRTSATMEGHQAAIDAVADRWLRNETPHSRPSAPSQPAGVSPSSGDPSAADYALCCDLAARGFRETEIIGRLVEKMEREGRHQKASRSDYLERTARKALAAGGGPAEAPEPIPCQALTDLLDEHQTRTPYIVEGILREGEVAALIAPPKCAKSFLLADLAMSCATGNHWHGHWPVRKGRVCLVDNELTRNEIAHRMREVMRAKGIDRERIAGAISVVSLRETNTNAYTVLEQLEAAGPFDLVIFDALYRFLEKGMDENSNADMTVLLRAFSRFAARTRAGVILVHHTAKGNQAGKDPIDAGSGAGSIGRAVDTHIVLFRHEEEDVFVERMSTRSSKRPGELAIRWEYPTFSDTTVADLEALHGSPKPKKKATD